MEESLDDVLSDKAVEEPQEVMEAADETAKGEVAETPSETEEQPKQPIESPEVSAFKAQALDERRKRQALEQQLRALEEQQRASQVEKPDFWDDPDKAIDSRIAQIQQGYDQKYNALAEHFTRSQHADYDEISDYFVEVLAPQNPALIDQARNQVNPFEFIYNATKAQKELAEVGDINALKAKLRAEVEAEVKASMQAEADKLAKIPGSLAGQRGASAPPVGVNDESLFDILGR